MNESDTQSLTIPSDAKVEPQYLYAHAMVLHMPENTIGQDYIAMDIHGSYGFLDAALEEVGFDGEVDRLFLGGDLIDRGEESIRCLEFLNKEGVYAIRGNHENMLLALYENGAPSDQRLNSAQKENGFAWWESVSASQRYEIIEHLRRLPLVIEIEGRDMRVGLIHAEVPLGMPWGQFKREVNMRNEKIISSCLWGRQRFKTQDTFGVLGINRLYVGHNQHFNGLQCRGNIVSLDTAAYLHKNQNFIGARLTLVNAFVDSSVLFENCANSSSPLDIRIPIRERIMKLQA